MWMLSSMLAVGAEVPLHDVRVRLPNADSDRDGLIRCAAFGSADGFPMDETRARLTERVSPSAGQLVFRLPVGRWAIACGHDENGDARVNTNVLGVPTEGWAASNNVKPMFRGPTFEESSFEVSKPVELSLRIHY